MGTRTGNPVWKDHPDTSTLVTAARLNAIEDAIDSGGGAVTDHDNGYLTWATPAGGGSEPVAQVGTITLPPSPALGQSITVVADDTTSLPGGITWDSGVAPSMATGRRILGLIWTGEDWIGTYSPVIPVAFATLSEAILSMSPAGYWPLDETSGTTATDYSGNSFSGTYTGGFTLAADGVTLNGTTGYVDLGDRDEWSVSDSGVGLTVFALVRPTSTPTTRQAILAKGDDPGQFEYGLMATGDVAPGKVEGSINTAAGDSLSADATTANPLTGGAWHAVAYAMPHPSGAALVGDVYVDSGVPQSLTAGSAGPGAYTNGTAQARIGSRQAWGYYFDGRFRHVAIFPRKLSQAEVGTLMTTAQATGLIP